MKKKILMPMLTGLFILNATNMVNAAQITNEDFEGGASGWSDNTTTDGGSPFTEFLGRHGGTGGSQVLYKDFSLSGNQTEVTIEFDFYAIDSWDGEYFNIYIDDVLERQDQFYVGAVPTGTIFLFGGADYGFNGIWLDQGVRYTLTVDTSATNLRLGFGTTLDQIIPDESWGIDNVKISDNSTAAPIPEPGTILLLGAGLAFAGISGRRNREKTN